MCLVTRWSAPGAVDLGPAAFGGRWPMEDGSCAALVLRTGKASRRPAQSIAGQIGVWLQAHGIDQVVCSPVTVEGHVWGVMVLSFRGSRPVPADIENRACEFIELASSAIAHAQSRAELIASRARAVMAADESRRRMERELHDGAQQRLISLGLKLRAAEAHASSENAELRRQLSEACEELSEIHVQLQEISRGLHPAILTQAGLGPAIGKLARRLPVPVELRMDIDRRLPDSVEVTVFYVVSEALANVLKHANASSVGVHLSMNDQAVNLAIHDDGVGGADPARGSGLIGLRDRIEAVEGTIQISSPAEKGTSVLAEIPIRQDELDTISR
jgi:signal transduction histidine kinase